MTSSANPQYKALDSTASEGMPCWKKSLLGACCICPVILFGLLYMGLVQYVSGEAISTILTLDEQKAYEFCHMGLDMKNMTSHLWWPGCGYVSSMDNFSSGCGGTCYDSKVMEKMQSLSSKLPAKIVAYPSRKHPDMEDVTLRGWWLPADRAGMKNDSVPPRIVVQHGFKSNSNMFRSQLFAYILRSMGFDVLVNNLRDHCYSDNSTAHVYEWGHAYPMDLLGAWDYAVNDPDGELGGKVDSKNVGLLGFSMGAFITNIAFGLEAKVPGVWVDAPPMAPAIVFANGLKNKLSGMGIGFMTDAVMPAVWSNVLKAASAKGVYLEHHLPKNELPQGPDTKRPIYTAHNKLDSTVPFSEGESLLELLKEYPEKYDVKGSFFTDKLCVDQNHCTDHLLRIEEYKEKLCDFWTDVFGIEQKTCGLSSSDKGADTADDKHQGHVAEERRLGKSPLHV